VRVGVEYFQRELETPIIDRVTTEASRIDDQRERRWLAYTYWTPAPSWALSAEIIFETFDRESSPEEFDPKGIDTLLIPVVVRYFAPGGWFAQLGASYLHQEVRRPGQQPDLEGSDDVVLLEGAVGYRLPDRRGLISLEARNLLDDRFSYQDENFRTSETRRSPIPVEAVVLARLTLNF
jgi:hypothetical protein